MALGRNLYLKPITATKCGIKLVIISFYLCIFHLILLSTSCLINLC